MPKTYLRYVHDRTVGVIASPVCNVVVDPTGTYACTGCLEDVGVWMVRTGRQVGHYRQRMCPTCDDSVAGTGCPRRSCR